ncbi:MAG: hypothetical protein ACREYF_22020 [Gammaproteobacteria bacterium]
MNIPGRLWAAAALLACLLVLSGVALTAEVNMAEVEALATRPVRDILKDSPFQEISETRYREAVRGSKRPVVVMFYSNEDRPSQNLATLLRYVAVDYSDKITFYHFMVVPKGKPDRPTITRMQKAYSLDKVPGTFFYDNDKSTMVLEKEDYALPTFKEYRTPGMFLWKVYYSKIREYIDKHILD